MKDISVKGPEMQAFLNKVSGLDEAGGSDRTKRILRRIVQDLCQVIEDEKVTNDEFWAAAGWLTELGKEREVALAIAGLGIEHWLDLRLDAVEAIAGIEGGTPRTIEGPLYVAGAPVEREEARLDDGNTPGEVLYMSGQVKDTHGKPLPDAVVEVWHADGKGNYSYFDPTQSAYNLRRTIQAGAEGRYGFRSVMPVGYAVPPQGPTKDLLDQLGRHGNRPAHIHFFISAPGYRKLTTQINIDGDRFLHDDFAFATRDGLIPPIERVTDPGEIEKRGLTGPFNRIVFDFVLHPESIPAPSTEVHRVRALEGEE